MKSLVRIAAFLAPLAAAGVALADTTPQTLPYAQDWSNTALIATDDDWAGVPGVTGYRGDNLTSVTGADPQTILAASAVVDVNANQTNPDTFITGGATEFEIADPAVALAGSGTADAPSIVIVVDTTGVDAIRVQYDVIDLDGSADDAIQQVALQYRIGNTGDFTNVPGGYIADGTTGGAAGQISHVDVSIPGTGGEAHVEVRMLTTNAVGNDEWIGIDNISITDAITSPSAVGAADPISLIAGTSVLFTGTVTPGTFPASTGLTVTCDLSQIGGSATQVLTDDGSGGDQTAGDNIFSLLTTVAGDTPAGNYTLPCTVADAESRSSTFSIALEVIPECGDGRVEGSEACDDANVNPEDGCSDTCTIETDYACTGEPSVCDVDQCATMTDDCVAIATCTDAVPGYTCACPTGYEGDGTTAGTGCADVDECTLGTDNCDVNAACANTDGGFTCTCNDGYVGDGTVCTLACGNGAIDGAEGCDDGGTTPGDGCDAACAVEAGWMCTGEPSTCSPVEVCGDGALDAGEECDDGNATAGDGCSDGCVVEDGWMCDAAEPSACVEDQDGDLIADADDNCPAVANPSQADVDGDGLGNACDDTDDSAEPDGGCCSSSDRPESTGGFLLLALLTLVGIRRRVR